MKRWPVNSQSLTLNSKEMTTTENNFAPIYFPVASWLSGIDPNLGTTLERNDAKQQFAEIFQYFSGCKQLMAEGKRDLPSTVNDQRLEGQRGGKTQQFDERFLPMACTGNCSSGARASLSTRTENFCRLVRLGQLLLLSIFQPLWKLPPPAASHSTRLSQDTSQSQRTACQHSEGLDKTAALCWLLLRRGLPAPAAPNSHLWTPPFRATEQSQLGLVPYPRFPVVFSHCCWCARQLPKCARILGT